MSSVGRPSSKSSPSPPPAQAPSGKVSVRTGRVKEAVVIEKKVVLAKSAEVLAGVVESPTSAATKTKSNPLPAEQYDLPVTFDQAGKLMTLKEVLQVGSSALSLSSLNAKQLVELTTLRITAQPKFEVVMVGAGIVDKARALKEVAAQTDVGRLLVEVEQRMIQRVLKRATP